MFNLTRFLTVFKTILMMLIILNIIIIPIMYFDREPGEAMQWEYIIYISLYGLISSLFFGYMDQPKLENKILKALFILTILLIIFALVKNYPTLLNHSLYFLFASILGRKLVYVVDLMLTNNKDKTKDS